MQQNGLSDSEDYQIGEQNGQREDQKNQGKDC